MHTHVSGKLALELTLAVDLLDELSHVLTQSLTARPLALSMAIERVGASMLLVTTERERDRQTERARERERERERVRERERPGSVSCSQQ